MYFSRIQLQADLVGSQLAKLLMTKVSGYDSHQILWELMGDPDKKQRSFLFREEFHDEQLAQSAKLKNSPLYYMVSATQPRSNALLKVESKVYQPVVQLKRPYSFRLRVNPSFRSTADQKRHDVLMHAKHQSLRALVQRFNIPVNQGLQKKSAWFKVIQEHMHQNPAGDLEAFLRAYIAKDARYQDQLEQHLNATRLLDCYLKSLADQAAEDWLLRKQKQHGFELLSTGVELAISAYRQHRLPEKGDKASFRSIDFAGTLCVTDVEKLTQSLMTGIGAQRAFGCGLLMIKPI